MVSTGYLRRQAETCLKLSENCSRGALAEELRIMAAEFFTRALETENRWLAPPEEAAIHSDAYEPRA